jgi:hypothetical protein
MTQIRKERRRRWAEVRLQKRAGIFGKVILNLL